MREIILVAHVVISMVLIASVLFQQTSQSGLGLGGAPSTSNDLARLLEGRAAANFFSNSSAVLGTLFFVTSITLALIMSAGTSNSLIGRFFENSRDPSQNLIEKVDVLLENRDATRAAEAGATSLSDAASEGNSAAGTDGTAAPDTSQ